MDDTAIEDTMDYHAESSTAAAAVSPFVLCRNDDPLTLALRSDTKKSLSLDDLVGLNRTIHIHRDTPSTLGSLTTTAFSSQHDSSVTKPTSAGTSHLMAGYNGKGKGTVVETYASSMSATHGSDSEADAEQDNVLSGIGDQFDCNSLRGSAGASKPKKVPLAIHHDGRVQTNPAENMDSVMSKTSCYSIRDTNNGKLHRRPTKPSPRQSSAADEESVSPTDTPNPTGASRARSNLIVALCLFIGLTLGLSIFAAHYTGKGRLACTKGIIFLATVLVSISTVFAMFLARRAPQEALLAGLFELVVGFTLVGQMRDFMESAS